MLVTSAYMFRRRLPTFYHFQLQSQQQSLFLPKEILVRLDGEPKEAFSSILSGQINFDPRKNDVDNLWENWFENHGINNFIRKNARWQGVVFFYCRDIIAVTAKARSPNRR